ncbi:MAG: hypothetical protein KGQ41_02765 [Alphaproteobacteria bacterium]|nr:hypothetical protein [Alphaproteobacteria bacterium]
MADDTDKNNGNPASRLSSGFTQTASRLALGATLVGAGVTGLPQQAAIDGLSKIPGHEMVLSVSELSNTFGISMAHARPEALLTGCNVTHTCVPLPTIAKSGAAVSTSTLLAIGLVAACVADASMEAGLVCDWAHNQIIKRGIKAENVRVSNHCDKKTQERSLRISLISTESVLKTSLKAVGDDVYLLDQNGIASKRVEMSKQELGNLDPQALTVNVDVVDEEAVMGGGTVKPERIMGLYKSWTEKIPGSFLKRAAGNGIVDDVNLTNVGSLTWHSTYKSDLFKPKEGSDWRRVQRTDEEIMSDAIKQIAKSFDTTPDKLMIGYTASGQKRQAPGVTFQSFFKP